MQAVTSAASVSWPVLPDQSMPVGTVALAAAEPCDREHAAWPPQHLLWQHLIGEPAAALELLNVGDCCAGNVLQGLSCEECRVRADENIGIRLEQLELFVPCLVALARAEGRPVLEEQGACNQS